VALRSNCIAVPEYFFSSLFLLRLLGIVQPLKSPAGGQLTLF
jgi:hypothetical protein